MFSTAAAVSYGCVASIHPMGLWQRRSTSIRASAADLYKPCYALGDRVSPHLASARPYRFALIHISERSRNARIANARTLWIEFFAPVLGVFETLKESHWPVATTNDRQLANAIPSETRVVVLPHAQELTDTQRSVVSAFESGGGTVIRLDSDQGWHLKTEKPELKRELMTQITAGTKAPPIRVRGPARMHAVFFQQPAPRKTVVCLVNDFGWFRSEREISPLADTWKAPPPCSGVQVEIANPPRIHLSALDAVTGRRLALHRDNGGNVRIPLPDFPIMACVVLE
jgi:hypothetical protein